METEIVKIDDLKPHPQNYRKHPEDELAHIAASIKTHGIYRNVVVAVDGTILAGHGVVEACRKLGHVTVPVFRLPWQPTDTRALKVLTGDNEIARLGEVDDRFLSDILKNILENDDEQLLGTGFDENQFANLVYVTRHSDEIQDHNAAREWIGLPEYEQRSETSQNLPVIEITFQNAADRERYVTETKLKIKSTRGDRKWATSWPDADRNDFKAIRFEAK